jgi:hypothetical protein
MDNYYPDIYVNERDISSGQANYMIMKIRLNFYQIWSIFNSIPLINSSKNAKSKYKWVFSDETGKCVYTIYDWNNSNRLLNTREWYIGANKLGKASIDNFLQVLCYAIECYNTYYRCIEENIFSSKYPVVDENLKRLKMELDDHKHVLELI